MKQIDIRDLQALTDEKLVQELSYAVECEGELLGHFIPKQREDPERKRQEAERFRRRLAEYRADGSLEPEILDNMERSLEESTANGRNGAVPPRFRPPQMRRIEITHLSDANDQARESRLREGISDTFEVYRDGVLIGYYNPRLKKDPMAMKAAWDAFERTIERVIRNGYTREQLEEDFDLSKPFREHI